VMGIGAALQDIGALAGWLEGQLCLHGERGLFYYIDMPFNYPDGTSVGVYIQIINGEYYVSDGGAGYEMACRAECGDMFCHYAMTAARQCGACFDVGGSAFVMSGLGKDELAGGVRCVAGASFLAVQVAVMAKDAIVGKVDELSQGESQERQQQ